MFDWKAVVTALITSIVVFFVLGLPSQVAVAVLIQPWIEKRKRLRDRAWERTHAPTKCARCERIFPAWFVVHDGCRHCSMTAYRLPHPDEEPEDFEREYKREQLSIRKADKHTMAMGDRMRQERSARITEDAPPKLTAHTVQERDAADVETEVAAEEEAVSAEKREGKA